MLVAFAAALYKRLSADHVYNTVATLYLGYLLVVNAVDIAKISDSYA